MSGAGLLSPQEARLLALERRIVRAGADVKALVPQIRALQQGLDDDWGGWVPITPTTLIATMSDASTSAAIVGAPVDLCDSSGNQIQTILTDGSGQSTFTITPGVTYNVGFYAPGYGGRGLSYGPALPGTNFTGFALTAGTFTFPELTNRTVVDPTYGSFVLPYTGGGGGVFNWDVTETLNYTGGVCGGCSSVTGMTVHFNLNRNDGGTPVNTLQIGYHKVGGANTCPATGAVNITHTNNPGTTALPEIHFPIVGGTGVNGPLYCTSGTIILK